MATVSLLELTSTWSRWCSCWRCETVSLSNAPQSGVQLTLTCITVSSYLEWLHFFVSNQFSNNLFTNQLSGRFFNLFISPEIFVNVLELEIMQLSIRDIEQRIPSFQLALLQSGFSYKYNCPVRCRHHVTSRDWWRDLQLRPLVAALFETLTSRLQNGQSYLQLKSSHFLFSRYLCKTAQPATHYFLFDSVAMEIFAMLQFLIAASTLRSVRSFIVSNEC